MEARVHVAGIGVISAIGNSVSGTLQSFRQHRSGIGPITHLDTIHKNILPVGEVRASDEELSDIVKFKKVTRTALLGIYAAKEAVKDSKIDLKSWRTGLISATTVGGMDRTEKFFDAFLKDPGKGRLRDVVNHECGRSTALIADALDVDGFVSTIDTACSSSVNSIIFATRLIRQGMLDVVIAGGTDALTRFTINGFNSLMILDSEPCRPFDASRNGLNLGEGAGFLVLVSDEVAKCEQLTQTCYVSGFANTNDAFHQTASSPEGRGSFAAMQQSLEMGGLKTTDIDYINLHGTGTVNNDQSEGTAILRLFDNKIPRISSTKSFTGHTLGACGGIEAVFSVMAIQEGCVFPNLRFNQSMQDMNALIPQMEFQEDLDVQHVMSNSFGFGGNCSSIIFSKR
ncbi:MAG TPA: beta-ketoacyl-[acyl-carrier-protein] synthase family protein [Cyclobacteriaceae bacterium]|nr:beta-ketoacyl-[acyl-carrier-protein] synthase family protein [Cyclobacteriaceae bacterium]